VESITRNTAYCNIRQKNSTIDALIQADVHGVWSYQQLLYDEVALMPVRERPAYE
jgi:desulfoferrodoxin (superoxide reductase-like protein)